MAEPKEGEVVPLETKVSFIITSAHFFFFNFDYEQKRLHLHVGTRSRRHCRHAEFRRSNI